MSTTTETQNQNGQDTAASTATTQATPEVEGYRVSPRRRLHVRAPTVFPPLPSHLPAVTVCLVVNMRSYLEISV